MRIIKTAEEIIQLGVILSVWAHPDDETFSCAGIMAAAVQNGQQVACVTATRGEKGVQDESRWPASKLGEIRELELAEALKVIGVTDHQFLNYPDGGCNQVRLEEGAEAIARHIDRVKPDSILTFGSDGMTGHPDHQAVSSWVDAAVKDMPIPPIVYHAVELRENYERYLRSADEEFNIYFNIEQPPLCECSDCDICLSMTDMLCEKKCAALRAMPSQTERIMESFGDEAKKIFCREAFVRTVR